MVGDDDPCRTRRHRLRCVSRVQHALEQHGQAGDGAQPGDVVPGGGLVQQAIEQCALPRLQLRRGRGLQAGQVHRADAWRQAKLRTALPVADTAGGSVHGQHQGFVTCGFRALHQGLGEAPVVLQIQLKPQRPAPWVAEHRLGDGLQRHTGLGAEHQPCAQRRGGIGGGQFAVRVGHALKGNGGQQDGVRQRAAQQADAGVPARQGAQHARPQGQGVPRAAVGAQGDFIGRPAAEVGPGVVVQLLARVLFVVGQAHHGGRNL